MFMMVNEKNFRVDIELGKSKIIIYEINEFDKRLLEEMPVENINSIRQISKIYKISPYSIISNLYLPEIDRRIRELKGYTPPYYYGGESDVAFKEVMSTTVYADEISDKNVSCYYYFINEETNSVEKKYFAMIEKGSTLPMPFNGM